MRIGMCMDMYIGVHIGICIDMVRCRSTLIQVGCWYITYSASAWMLVYHILHIGMDVGISHTPYRHGCWHITYSISAWMLAYHIPALAWMLVYHILHIGMASRDTASSPLPVACVSVPQLFRETATSVECGPPVTEAAGTVGWPFVADC